MQLELLEIKDEPLCLDLAISRVPPHIGQNFLNNLKVLEHPMSDLIQNLSEDSFQNDVLEADGPILVDFGQNGVALAARLPQYSKKLQKPTKVRFQ